MRVAIYARVSSESQAQEGTIESQLVALRDYAKAHDYEIAHECIDEGYSGTNLTRPGLDRLRDLAAQGEIESALILAPDRLARNIVHQFVILEELEKRAVKVIFTNYKLGDTPEDHLLLGIQGLFSEYERTKLLDRTRRGRIQHAKNGHIIGGSAPYGYRFVHKTKDAPAHYEIDPAEAETVRLIYRLAIEDKLSLRAIGRYLADKSIPTRSRRYEWASSTLADVLRNEAYTGTAYAFRYACVEPKRPRNPTAYRKVKNTSKKLRSQEDWIPVPIVPIIDRQTFDAARAQMNINTQHSSRNNKRNQYLFGRMIVCGLCACHISGTVSGHYSYYRCDAKRSGSKKAIPHDESVSVRHPKLDELVWNVLVNLLDDPARLEEHIAKRLAAPVPDTQSPRFQANDKAMSRLEAEEERILDAYREKVIDLSQLKSQMDKLSAKRAHLKSLRETLTRPPQSPQRPQITRAMLGDLSARYRRAMAGADFAARRQIVESLVTQVALYPGKAVVSGVIPIDNGALRPLFAGPPGSLARGRYAAGSP